MGMSLKALINDRLRAYGEAIECKVDTRAGRISLTAVMRGEREPVTAVIERYELERVEGDHYIVLQQFSSSREWLATLMTQLFTGKRYKLPSAINRLL